LVTFIANVLRNYLPRSRNKLQHKISVIIFAAYQVLFRVSYPAPPPHLHHRFPPSQLFLCCWFRNRKSDWSDVPLHCVN
jgi:hypothetical protein